MCLENTVNKAGGSYYSISELKKIRTICQKHDLKLHLDGARLFNALVETNESAKSYGKLFDSISVCLSKGLGAPVGSLIIGTKSFIKSCRRTRKSFGGNMRQAGYLAAAGIYALDHNLNQLKKDNHHASILAETLAKCSFTKNILPADTNIVIFDLVDRMNYETFEIKMNSFGIRFSRFGPKTIRFVTHRDFSPEMLEYVCIKLPKI